MTDGLTGALTFIAAIGSALVAGVFFAFSSFVMKALARIPPPQGIAAMQSINKLAVTPAFMTALFGSALACAGLAAWGVVSWGERPAPWLLAGGVLFLMGAIVVTIAANVPLNDALAATRPDGTGAADRWRSYLGRWTAWNHLRAAAALAATGLLIVALQLD